jgi:hypothetical protein
MLWMTKVMNGTLCHEIQKVMPFSIAIFLQRLRCDNNALKVLVNLECIDI